MRKLIRLKAQGQRRHTNQRIMERKVQKGLQGPADLSLDLLAIDGSAEDGRDGLHGEEAEAHGKVPVRVV